MIRYLYKNGCRYFVYATLNEYKKLKVLAPDAVKIIQLNINAIKKDGIDYGLMQDDIINKPDFDGITFHFSKHSIKSIDIVFAAITNIILNIPQKKAIYQRWRRLAF